MKKTLKTIFMDKTGCLRFKENAIVQYLLKNGGIDMNHLARLGDQFTDEDREQFAQLIGYSLSGFSDLSYVSNETYETAKRMAETGKTQEQAQIEVLQETLAAVRDGVKAIAPHLFKIHPDDLVS